MSKPETINSSAEPLMAAVIPAYNEANSIYSVVEAAKQYVLTIVVDDGSDDETAHLARQAGAIVVSHSNNRGYDAAIQTGLFKAIELGCTFAITIDADGQHNPAVLEHFKTALLEGADLVVGARDRHQRFSESLFAVMGKLLWSIEDPLCGVKGYRLSHLKRLGHFDCYNSIGTEFAIRCARSHLRIEMVPVLTNERFGISRFGDGLKANFRILRALLIGLINAKSF
jgi:glycosyltransferase involved in cell wall biosynthesis